MGSNRRVTDPFNEKVRVRIFGLSSSTSSSISSCGSEHEGEYDIMSPSPSPCLSYLVQSFLEDESSTVANDNTTSVENVFEPGLDEDLGSNPTALINDVINPIVRNNADHFRMQLLFHVAKAVEMFSVLRNNKTSFLTNITTYLREIGYNAGACKTKWASSGSKLTAGNYEFLDVISPGNDVRYIIDTDFSSEFEIARESENYKILRTSLPRVFICKTNEIKKIVRLMSDEAKKSMKINGLNLPPWRKNRYMQMKWLGPYRRRTSQVSLETPVFSPVASGSTVKCRAVGFDVVVDGDRFLFPAVTRIR